LDTKFLIKLTKQKSGDSINFDQISARVTYNGLYSNFFNDIEAINSMPNVKLIISSEQPAKKTKMKERKPKRLNPKRNEKK
jgi:hypothetical protein